MSSMSATAATRARRITHLQRGDGAPRQPRLGRPACSIARMWERRSARKRFASLCSGYVRSAPPACAVRAAAASSGLELHVLLHRDRRVELDALLHLRPAVSGAAAGAAPAPRPRARGAAPPRGRPRRSRRTGGRWERPAVADLELAATQPNMPATFWPAWKQGSRSGAPPLRRPRGAQVRAPGASARTAGGRWPTQAALRWQPFAHGRPLASASRRPSRCVRRGVSLVHDSLPRRLVATEVRRPTGSPVRVALAQLNTVVGDIDGNAGRVAAALADAGEAGRTSPWSPSSRSRATRPRTSCCGRPSPPPAARRWSAPRPRWNGAWR